jgi:epoxide hydrolase-like predicted phosphatase
MTVQAVFFDIGGVLEITPPTGWVERWEARLGLIPGGLSAAARDVFAAGSTGAMTEADVHQQLAIALGVEAATIDEMMADSWMQYLGTPNAELIDYMASLRPRYKVGIISNSFVGAREREQRLYRFEDLTDDIVYSHEVGVLKPDPRIYELACERLEVEPAAAAYIDDHVELVEGARAAGMIALLFEDNDQILRQLADLL